MYNKSACGLVWNAKGTKAKGMGVHNISLIKHRRATWHLFQTQTVFIPLGEWANGAGNGIITWRHLENFPAWITSGRGPDGARIVLKLEPKWHMSMSPIWYLLIVRSKCHFPTISPSSIFYGQSCTTDVLLFSAINSSLLSGKCYLCDKMCDSYCDVVTVLWLMLQWYHNFSA